MSHYIKVFGSQTEANMHIEEVDADFYPIQMSVNENQIIVLFRPKVWDAPKIVRQRPTRRIRTVRDPRGEIS